MLANKALLASMLRALPPEQRDFAPETLLLSGPEDVAAVRAALGNATRGEVWILKPADLSKGLGVTPLPSPATWALQGGPQRALASGRAHVVQRYIERPLLLDGFKSEVRVYFLVASARGYIACLWRCGNSKSPPSSYIPLYACVFVVYVAVRWWVS